LIVDTNVWISRWPFRRLPSDTPAALVDSLRRAGVAQAWAGNLDSVFHKDLASANAELARVCSAEKSRILVPFGTVNPSLPDWEEDFRRAVEVHQMRGIRLSPNYHGYTLTDERFTRLLSLAAERSVTVQVTLALEDERTQHPLIRVPPLDPEPLVDIIPRVRGLRLALLNRNWAEDWTLVTRLSRTGDVYFDFAMLEGLGALGSLLERASPDRVLFNSHLPCFYLESALLKVREAALSPDQRTAILERNARRLVAGGRR
jgi:predicted TIM-barrel fold metal-dependent hydrolase